MTTVAGHPDGTYTATITASKTVGAATVTATDSTPATPISAQKTLTQTRGPAVNVSLLLDPSSVPANGTATSTATATIIDGYGHPATGDTVTITSADDQLITAVSAGSQPGTYIATIQATNVVRTSTITATTRPRAPRAPPP